MNRTPVFRRTAAWLLLAGGLGSAAGLADAAERPVDSAVRLNEQFEAYFEELLTRDSVFASEIGDPRYNDRLENFLSPEHLRAEKAFRERWIANVEPIDRGALRGQDRLSYDIFLWEQRRALDELRFPRHLLPVSQLFGVPTLFAQLGSGEGDHPFRTEKDYRDFLARIEAWVAIADQIVANLGAGIEAGVVQPRILMEKALPQLAEHLVTDPTESVFYRPLLELPEGMDVEVAAALRQAYQEAIRTRIVPSYRKIHEFVRDRYLPACRKTIGLSALPDGAAWYAQQIKLHTTTELTPDEVHGIGVAEVERIQGAMIGVLRELEFGGGLEEFRDHLRASDRFYAPSAEALVDGYEELRSRVETAMPRLFDFPADARGLEIRPVPDFYASSAPAAIYNPGSPDGARAGAFYVNTHDLRSRPTYLREALFLHEALPGHHFQTSIARGAGELPRFRRFVLVNAYVEGWGLYSESLGSELGLYTDPYSRFGRLDNEMLRALRLVVDTGIHARGWSREQAIAYLTENSSLGESDIVAEVERYVAWPGQALAYKIGELRFQRLRRAAEDRLGDRFDAVEFHHEVLQDGALPLSVLERKIDEWLAGR